MMFFLFKIINISLIILSAYLLYSNKDLENQIFHRLLFILLVCLFILSGFLDLH